MKAIGLVASSTLAVLGAGFLAVMPAQAAQPIALPEPEVTVADIRTVRDEFADVTETLQLHGPDLESLLTSTDEWLGGVSGNDPGTGQPWVTVISQQLSEGHSDVQRLQAESGDIGQAISRALTALRKDNQAGAFRILRTVAIDLNRLTEDAASAGNNITITLGSAQTLLEKFGNGGGLRRIARSLRLQTGLMRDLRQTEAAVPPSVFPDVIRGDVEPEQIKPARQSFQQVTAALDAQLDTVGHLLANQSTWGQASEEIDPGTGQLWGTVLGTQVEASRADIRRLGLRADGISGSLSRALRSARLDNEGGLTLALRSASRAMQQLRRDAQGSGNNLTMTLTATRPLLEAIGDGGGLRKLADSLRLQGSLLNLIDQSQQEVGNALKSRRVAP
jgi:hypothetical protein